METGERRKARPEKLVQLELKDLREFRAKLDPGIQGEKGDTGAAGTNGVDGADGATGPQGEVGPKVNQVRKDHKAILGILAKPVRKASKGTLVKKANKAIPGIPDQLAHKAYKVIPVKKEILVRLDQKEIQVKLVPKVPKGTLGKKETKARPEKLVLKDLREFREKLVR